MPPCYVTELLKTASEARFLSACRMLRETFKRLLEACVTRGELKKTKNVSAAEKLMILIHVL